MTLREELQNRADKLDAELLALSGRIRALERESDDVHTCINALDIAEMDAQDAALGPAPDITFNDIEPVSVTIEAPALADPPSAELRSVTPATEEESGGQFEGEPSEFISDLTGDPAIEPESGLHGEPEPTELDAPASIVDDPELQAAVARAEQALAIDAQTCEPIYPHPQPAYVGLQDADLDADYDAMREREMVGKPKLHFSIFGKREDA